MSNYRYIKSSNPFEDDDEDDDFGKAKNSTKKNSHTSVTSSYSASNGGYMSRDVSSPFDDRRENIQRQIDNSENTQLESTQRALASIYDSEAMGVATAEELLRQGETLDSIENKTDGIQTTLKTSQRHLNSIKSVFGGIKNWWKGDKNSPQEVSSSSRSRLREEVEKIDKDEKPKSDFSGFYEDNDNDLDTKFMANAPKSTASKGGYSMISPVTRSAREEDIDDNLSLMCSGMGRLKGLAAELGNEIDQQNQQLDRINTKVEAADGLVIKQNSQMKRILRK